MWEWVKEVVLGVVLVPIAIDAVKRFIKDLQDVSRLRKAAMVDLSLGGRIFSEVATQVDASLRAIAEYKERPTTEGWLDAAETMVATMHSGFVVEEPYVDAKAILATLSWQEGELVTIALETWRRFRLHEALYRGANEKLMADLSRLRQANAPEETAFVRELVSRLAGELEQLRSLMGDYQRQSAAAIFHVREKAQFYNKMTGADEPDDGLVLVDEHLRRAIASQAADQRSLPAGEAKGRPNEKNE